MNPRVLFRKTAMLAACAALMLTGQAQASGDGHGGHAAATANDLTPAQTLKAAVDGNALFTHEHGSDYFKEYQTAQTPHLTVVSCADSRVHTGLFGMDPNNNIFLIRNIGNQLSTAAGSVDYGINHLPTRILMIMGHSSCGAVKAAMSDYSGETAGIKSELDSLGPVIKKDSSAAAFDARWAMNVERNVDYQVAQATKLYAERIAAGTLAVVGAVYDFNNLYGKGSGALVITNINGEADPNAIMQHPVLQELAKATIVTHVGSLAPAL